MTGEVISISIEGMNCQQSAEAVKKAVASLNGVVDVAVSLADRKLVVEFDKERVPEEVIRNVIEDHGYRVR